MNRKKPSLGFEMNEDHSSLRACGAPALASTNTDDGAPLSAAEPSERALPVYVTKALRGLTPAQKQFVIAGCLHGDFTMVTVRALKQKALFYFHPTSPNGRCGELRLTPLGETVRSVLLARAAHSQWLAAIKAECGAPPADTYESHKHEGEAEVTNTSGGRQ